MTSDQGFKLHPEAARDITDIWEYIAEENPLAAGRVREEILNPVSPNLLQFSTQTVQVWEHNRFGDARVLEFLLYPAY
jgi:plasmid stabilization system protein ParE